MATEDSATIQTPRLTSLSTSRLVEPEAAVNEALIRLIEAQNELASSLETEHGVQQTRSVSDLDALLVEAQTTANQIVERAELEALTLRRLMRIEAERLLQSVERLKERAAQIEITSSP